MLATDLNNIKLTCARTLDLTKHIINTPIYGWLHGPSEQNQYSTWPELAWYPVLIKKLLDDCT